MKYINRKSLFALLMALVLVFSIAACGGGEADGGDGGEDTGAEATEAPAGGDIVAQFTFNNTGAEEICELYLSPAGMEDWGNDQLAGQTILGGEKFILKNIPAGSYDVKAIGCNGGEAIGQLDIQN